MKPDRWQKVEELYHAALEHPAASRADFLRASCGDDEDLYREVESLLGFKSQAENFIEKPALEVAAKAVAEDSGTSVIGKQIGNYQILSFLGQGGMGEVYLAQDTSLGRKVALKFLPHYLAKDEERLRRFEQEARAASALNHPNILTIHEIGEADGRRFIATEFIDGETLRQKIIDGPLKWSEALNIAEQIGSALAQAHAAGIIHRDIKPENIMLRRDGYAKVLDFGLAKLTEQKDVGSDGSARTLVKTSEGIVMGTVTYMSPEQVRGLAVDARSDIWSLGVVLYEMLAGCAPFTGETTGDVIASILRTEARPLTSFNDGIPVELERIVLKAMSKERQGRCQTTKELLSDLRQLKKQLEFSEELERTVPLGKRGESRIANSIAVLPFANMSADPENEYFCDGLAEELLNALAKIEVLKVAARTSAFSFKGKNTNVSEIGRVLKVNSVLEGSVRKSGNRLRITVQLINASDGYHLWSERYDREMRDIFDVQDEITLAVVDALKVRLLGEEKATMLKRHTDSPEAYQAYLKGRYYWNKRTPEGFKKGIEHFQQAIEIDPGYAVAYSGLADSYHGLGYYSAVRSKQAFSRAKAAATRALEIDETLAEAHTSMAWAKLAFDWNWAGAESEFKRAIQLNPSYATAHHWYALYLAVAARLDEALVEIRRAQDLDPLSLIINTHVGWILYLARQYDQAVEQYRKASEMDPSFYPCHILLGELYEQKEIYDDAITEFETARNLSGESALVLAALAHTYALSGKRSEAEDVLAKLKELSKQEYVSRYHIATIYTALGEKDQAFAWLGKAVEDRSCELIYLGVTPVLDSLRSDLRFKDLLQRIGLPPVRAEATRRK